MKLLALLDRDFASVPAQKTAATPKQTPVGRAESSKKRRSRQLFLRRSQKKKQGNGEALLKRRRRAGWNNTVRIF